MKIAVIGGGSTYTPELVDGLLRRKEALPVRELWLMDIAPDRLETVGEFARRMTEAAGSPFTVHLTTDQAEAVRGATFVVTQIRVGGMQCRLDGRTSGWGASTDWWVRRPQGWGGWPRPYGRSR